MELKKLPKIALGAWAWGNDGTFGGSLSAMICVRCLRLA